MDVVSLSKALYKALREREQDVVESLAGGLPSSWDQYQHMVGELRGLAYAKEELKARLEQITQELEGGETP
jgi:exonuclease VII small subunit